MLLFAIDIEKSECPEGELLFEAVTITSIYTHDPEITLVSCAVLRGNGLVS